MCDLARISFHPLEDAQYAHGQESLPSASYAGATEPTVLRLKEADSKEGGVSREK